MLLYRVTVGVSFRPCLGAAAIHCSAVRAKAGHYKITPKAERPLTYEQANPPYRIGVTKSWNTWNSSTLRNAGRAPKQIAIEDQFISKFILGTWYRIWLSEVIIKRRHNDIIVCGLVCPLPTVKVVHFLTGYSEELLSHLLQSNVRIEVQCVNSKNDLIYKHI